MHGAGVDKYSYPHGLMFHSYERIIEVCLYFEIVNDTYMCLAISWDWLMSALYQRLPVDITSIMMILILRRRSCVHRRDFLNACPS